MAQITVTMTVHHGPTPRSASAQSDTLESAMRELWTNTPLGIGYGGDARAITEAGNTYVDRLMGDLYLTGAGHLGWADYVSEWSE